MSDSWKNKYLYKNLPAQDSLINELKQVAPVKLPLEYFEFLSFANGGEWDIATQPYIFVSDPVETVRESIINKVYEEFFSGFLIIGSNGSGEFIAFDIRKAKPWPIVAVDMTNIDLNESVVVIAKSFDLFLELLGNSISHSD